jgi:TatD DNase family protein
VHSGVGLHPELLADRVDELDELLELVSQTRLIGEVGLDGSSRYRLSYEHQKTAFRHTLEASLQFSDRGVSIHSRSAVGDVINTLRDNINKLKRGLARKKLSWKHL